MIHIYIYIYESCLSIKKEKRERKSERTMKSIKYLKNMEKYKILLDY